MAARDLLPVTGAGGGGGKGGGGGTEGCADTFVVVIMDPAVAKYEMSDLRFIQG